MSQPRLFSTRASLVLTTLVALLIYGALQSVLLPTHLAGTLPRDGDDALRLASVRDLLGGQGWFDMTQYRVAPPEGLDLHWSRLVDAPIAGLVLGLKAFVPAVLAERLATAIWPALLFVLFVFAQVRAAIFAGGYRTACVTALMAALMPVFAGLFFSLGRIDHHNLQLVLMAGVLATLLAPDDFRMAGWVGGVLAGLSLAVGLETLPFMLLAGLVLTLRWCADPWNKAHRLGAYSLALALAGTVFHLAQAPLAEWRDPHCDTLGVPMSAIPYAAAIVGLLLAGSGRYVHQVVARVLLALLLTGAAAAVLYFALIDCAEGPYADVPADIRATVIAQVLENRPFSDTLRDNPRMAANQALPFVLSFVLLLPAALRRSGGAERALLAFLALGMGGALFQLRLLLPAAAVLPVAAGLGLMHFAGRGPLPWMRWPLVPVLAVLLVLPQLPVSLLPGQPERAAAPGKVGVCRDRANYAALNDLPPSVLLTHMNIGPRVVIASHHAVTSASYHRSPQALAAGLIPFQADAAVLSDWMARTGADYLLVCPGRTYGTDDSAARALSSGDSVAGFERVDLPQTQLMLFRQVSR